MQQIYGKETIQYLPSFEFPSGFCLKANLKDLSNTDESFKFLKEVIKLYVEKQRQLLKHSTDQKTLVIMNVFIDQKTTVVLEDLKEADMYCQCSN